jgi:hypothetical protein
MNVRNVVGFLSLVVFTMSPALAQETNSPEADQKPGLEEQRMDVMRERAMAMKFTGGWSAGLPGQVQSQPLFRYDDVPRGYVDGAVWRWGQEGRPYAIITTELHPKYLGGGPKVVYDFLSLSDASFTMKSDDSSWQPSSSAVTMQNLENGPKPADTQAQRLFQMKRIMQRFAAQQVVSEEKPAEIKLRLRLLPRPIDRYQPPGNENADGATFLFVAGRMPGIIVFLETDGQGWKYGIGRLSAPSTLRVTVDEIEVYLVPPSTGSSRGSYNATNSTCEVPGY